MAHFDWTIDQKAKRININGNLIVEKAKRIQIRMNEQVSVPKKPTLNFSAGWLGKFKSGWNQRVFKSHRESGDADLEAAVRELPLIKEKLRRYDPKDIFNADECGLFFKMAPDKTVSTERLPGRKKTKDRITLLFCYNADDSQKFEIMAIGKSRQLRAFKKKTPADLGIDYDANWKAWMTSILFLKWLERFNAYISRTASRKVVLLIDNCSAHGALASLPPSNVEIMFLLSNTTSKLQPLDSGINASFKIRYRKKQMERAVDLVDEDFKGIYKVNILTAISCMNKVWSEVPSSVIKNCWHHAGILLGGDISSRRVAIDNLVDAGDESELKSQLI